MAEPARATRVSAKVHLAGLHTPHGLAGASLEVEYDSKFRLAAGAGLMPRAIEGRQYSAMASALFGPQRRFSIGLGASTGGYVWEQVAGVDCDESCESKRWLRTVWLDAQLGFRHRFSSNWHVTPYIGLSLNLEPNGADVCYSGFGPSDCDQLGNGGARRIYAGVALGRSF